MAVSTRSKPSGPTCKCSPPDTVICYEDRPESVFRNVVRLANADVLFFGHTHLPYQKQVEQTLFFDAGSVGKPKDGDPRAGYLIADFGPQLDVRLRRVEYDVAAAARAVRASGLPEHFADLLETGGGSPATGFSLCPTMTERQQ